MAICCRKNCGNIIPSRGEAKNLRLCQFHFSKKIELHLQRTMKDHKECFVCGQRIALLRNEKYCSNKCKGIGLRSIDDDHILAITQHSYWLNVERFIKTNPLQLRSINKLQDITDLIGLYKLKSTRQHSYNFFLGEKKTSIEKGNEHKLIPFMQLELCHLYPNSAGGMNTAMNFIIGPAFINRMVKDCIPFQREQGLFNGMKCSGKIIPVKTGLMKAIKKYYAHEKIISTLKQIDKIPRFSREEKRDITQDKIYNTNLIFDLLCNEAKRLNLDDLHLFLRALSKVMHKAFRYKKITILVKPYFLDMLGLAIFHAILTGDRNDFIDRVVNNKKKQVVVLKLILIARQYINSNFKCNFKSYNAEDEAIELYKKVFSIPPVYINGEGYPKWMISDYGIK